MDKSNQKSTLLPILDIGNFQANNLEGLCILDHSIEGKSKIDPPHKHDFFLFFLIEKGGGYHRIDFTSYPVSNKQLHILNPGQVHDWELDQKTRGYQLMIGKNEFEEMGGILYFLSLYQVKSPVLQLLDEEFMIFHHEFLQILNESKLPKPDKGIVRFRCNIIIKLIIREIEKITTQHHRPLIPELLLKYLSDIDEFYKKEKSMVFYAEKLNITPNYLNIICKKHLGKTAYSLIKSRISLEAKRLLSISNITVKELAFELGFQDPANFSKFFREETGTSPSDFRSK
ncbi:helix-turn-helix domain-containing protein [Arthrospiribacter ruber]|uniref:AraC family transcriptional regulator n=1 Tax=Arthrospiribacter ruber TaxID=2487934 RepID=A0A951ITM1_9BACT|nr:helix-turn-helix domain-containing protein [Arthrospiribacter ruber]MBW3467038.1 AraC family transcriptional regulator [Arthrospiribacter ruber]